MRATGVTITEVVGKKTTHGLPIYAVSHPDYSEPIKLSHDRAMLALYVDAIGCKVVKRLEGV